MMVKEGGVGALIALLLGGVGLLVGIAGGL